MQEHHRERHEARLTLACWLCQPDLRSVRPRICSSAAAVSLSWRCRSKRSSVGEASPFVPPRGSWCIPAAASVKGRFSHARPRRIVLCNCQSAVRRCCEKLVLRCGWCGELTVRRSAGVAVPRKLRSGETSELGNHAGRISRAASASAIGGSGVWLTSVPLLERPPCKPVLRPVVLRSTDIKAAGCDGSRDFRGERFERPVFAGVRGDNVARDRH
jgi:hypothetical protein